MPLRDLNLATPPDRVSAWSMFNEAWGYFTGQIHLSDFAAINNFQESQIAFVPSGHAHPSGVDFIRNEKSKLVFNRNACDVAWGHYFSGGFQDGKGYMILTGGGTVDMTTEEPTSSGFYYGVVDLDWDPTAVSAPSADCELDLREMSAFDSAEFAGTYTLLGAWASFTGDLDGAQQAYGLSLGFDTVWFLKGTTTNSTADVPFDYWVLVSWVPA